MLRPAKSHTIMNFQMNSAQKHLSNGQKQAHNEIASGISHHLICATRHFGSCKTTDEIDQLHPGYIDELFRRSINIIGDICI